MLTLDKMPAYDELSTPSLSILVVDDSAIERTLLSLRLNKQGHTTTEVGSGQKALEYLNNPAVNIDLILLDVLMPDLSGFETAKMIRAIEKKHGQRWHPIIFLSSRESPKYVAEGIEAGGDDYLVKPVDSLILKSKIQAIVRLAEMRQRILNNRNKLWLEAQTDELTQLPNRRHFYSVLDKEIAQAKRYETPLSIAYFDLDHFKRINDQHGHEAGDKVLCSVSSAIMNGLRHEDSIARIGGEEFCICLPMTSALHSIAPCERYRTLIENLLITSNLRALRVTASFGITDLQPLTDSRSSFLARADQASYLAKHAGRNCVMTL